MSRTSSTASSRVVGGAAEALSSWRSRTEGSAYMMLEIMEICWPSVILLGASLCSLSKVRMNRLKLSSVTSPITPVWKNKIMIPATASSVIHQDLLEGTARKPPGGFCSTPRPLLYTLDGLCAKKIFFVASSACAQACHLLVCTSFEAAAAGETHLTSRTSDCWGSHTYTIRGRDWQKSAVESIN